MRKIGIYSITNIVTKLQYIGSSINMSKRFSRHRDDLKNNKHDNNYLQNAWNKYWCVSFKFEIIEFCEKDKLIEREQYWIDTLNTVRPNGYNLKPIASSNLGIVWSLEARANMSAAQKGRKLSAARVLQIKKSTAHLIGVKRNSEIDIKISKALKGKTFTIVHKTKLSLARLAFLEKQKQANILSYMGMGC